MLVSKTHPQSLYWLERFIRNKSSNLFWLIALAPSLSIMLRENKKSYGIGHRRLSYETFFFVNDTPDKKARVFVLGMTFQPKLLFGGKATAYQSGEVHPLR
jgi:hypothetical protein